MRFRDRRDAARALARLLAAYGDRKDVVLLAIPRGGVVIGAVLASELNLPLDVVLTKKIGHPLSAECAIGVVSLAGEMIDEEIVERDRISRDYVEKESVRIGKLLLKRYRAYRGGASPLPLRGKIVVIVDDGIATGHTMSAAVLWAQRESAKKVVAAAPVASSHAAAALRELADEVVCVVEEEDFSAIGQFYENFGQVEDAEAIRLLRDKGGYPSCELNK